MRIVHVWDQASYAKHLASYSRDHNYPNHRFPKLPDFGLGHAVVSTSGKSIPYLYGKSLDFFIASLARTNCVFEFHSIALLQKFPELVERSILHVHGSEVRSFTSEGGVIDSTTSIDQSIIKNVPLVFYSTPDLVEILSKYTGRLSWAPHLTNVDLHQKRISKSQKKFDVVFPSALHHTKGSSQVLALVRNLISIHPDLSFALVNSGSEAHSLDDLRVHRIKIAPREKFHKTLLECDIALGQGFGLFGAVDIESIQLGLRHFPLKFNPAIGCAYGVDKEDFPQSESLIPEFLEHFGEKNHRYSVIENAVKFHHSGVQVSKKRAESIKLYLE
jgi:hypothetical protein